MSGWFSIKHGIRKHPIFRGRPERLGAWVAMLDEAAFSDTEQNVSGQIIKVKRGELCASQAMLEDITGLPRQQLRTFLNMLKNAGTIKTRPATNLTKSRTIVTFCNYDHYQAPQPRTNQGPTKDQPTKEQGNNITEDTNVSSGKAKQMKSQPKSRIPEDWAPSDENMEYALSKKLTHAEIQEIADDFQAYWFDRTDARGSKSERGWRQAWCNWIRNEAPKVIRGRNVVSGPFPGGGGSGGGIAGVVARRRLGDEG